jgi:hypothetical protein
LETLILLTSKTNEMADYKKASRLNLKFETPSGLLTLNRLWDLKETDLDTMAVKLEEEYNESGKKSFLIKASKKNEALKLKFDIVLDILQTKLEEAEVNRTALDEKARRSKIETLIAEKKDEELKGLSVEELQKLL